MDVFDVSRYLATTADLMEIAGGPDAPKALAYRRASHSLSRLTSAELGQLSSAGRLQEIPGVGPALGKKIAELLATGRMAYLDRLLTQIPASVIQLLEIPGLGPKTVATLYRELGVSSLDELEAAVRDGRLPAVRGLGPHKERVIRDGIALIRSRKVEAPLGAVVAVARALAARLKALGVVRVEVAGDIRRGEEMVRDLTLVAEGQAEEIRDGLITDGIAERVIVESKDVLTLVLPDGRQARIVCADRERFGAALLFGTGSSAHLSRLDELARRTGRTLSELASIHSTEKDLYGALGLPLIPPELRTDGNEIDQALAGRLPALVSLDMIRGDLHVHSRYSHGLDELDTIAETAAAMGYEYLAICDHSRSLVIAGGLSIERLRQQGEEIGRINRTAGCRLLWGAEVDIMRDGSLDYPDEVLASLDVVVASVHTGFSMGRDDMTRRIVSAARNPHVDIIGHLTGRLLGYRRGYDVDISAVIDACRESGTMLEINSSGDRLDIGADVAARAVSAGVCVAIDSDAHSAGALRDVELGVRIARRGGIGPDMIANAWPLDRLLGRLGPGT